MSPRVLHVANGTSTTGTIQKAGIPGTSSIWADVLHEGPVPGDLSDEQLLEVRARYLADGFDRSFEETVSELKRWRAAIEDAASYDELILWFEHDLFDQLNLIQVLSRIAQTVPAAKPVSLICIGSFPGRQHFKGLGELTPDELASLLETRQRVGDAQCTLAERAWQAFRAADPRQIEDLLRTDTSALPFLEEALKRHLEEFPSVRDGLSRSERSLMELAQAAPVDLWTAFSRMHEQEAAFYIADGSFWRLVQHLAALVALDVKGAARHQLPQGTVWITDTGRAVLRGEVDRVRQCGLDRWLGGVHLQGSQPMWRWDDGHGRIVRTGASD